jgi:hypothetical protein
MAIGITAILDDIAALMDDMAVATKIATKKTAGILGDDLAVNAEKSSGFHASREIPVLWEITKGSFKNKAIILPVIFLLSYFAPFIIVPILLVGGLYLAFEGVEKVYEFVLHKFFKVQESTDTIVLSEEEKVKSAILTDFILSIEIIVIALGTVIDKSLGIQILAVTAVAVFATIGVYGLVALLVKIDDLGFYILSKSGSNLFLKRLGNTLVLSLPLIIKVLSVIGTIAMLIVAGGIFSHNIDLIHHLYSDISYIYPIFLDLILGLIIGAVLLIIYEFYIHKIKK